VSFPELGRQVAISLKGGYDPASTDTDLSKRDIEAYETRFIKPYGSGTARVFFFQQWLDMAIDGVTFYGGVGDSGVGGGALLLNESNTSKISITRCKFDSNTSNSYGGAIVGSKLVGDITIEDCQLMATHRHVTENTPPAFLWHTFADQLVPVRNSIDFAAAMADAGLSCEMHIYPYGPHATGLGNYETWCGKDCNVRAEIETWAELSATWVKTFN
jgi:predicted outer membrane repeat protein